MDVDKIIKETANDFVVASKKEREKSEKAKQATQTEEIPLETPVDMLQSQRRDIREKLVPRARGAGARLGVDLSVLEQGNLAYAYKRAKDEGEAAEREGDRERARLIREAYMQDTLLPTVDALVGMNGAEAVLANQDVLNTLDHYALVEGGGSRGFTQSLISSLYDLTSPQNSPSDGYVRLNMSKLSSLCGDGQIRAAVGLATQLKNSIDKGEHVASPEDYELIQKVIFKSR